MVFDKCEKTYTIRTFNFNEMMTEKNSGIRLDCELMGSNWPAVYILHGSREVYVGESSNVSVRMKQHLDKNGKYYAKRSKLETVEIVFDPHFNKSAVLDFEQQLIELFKFEIRQTRNKEKKSLVFDVLQNGNRGQSKMHNYYRRSYYQDQIQLLWNELKDRGLARNYYNDIKNDSLFKYSPYTTLNEQQYQFSLDFLERITESLSQNDGEKNSDFTGLINGAAGTGKTIFLLNILRIIANSAEQNQADYLDGDFDASEEDLIELKRYTRISGEIEKIIKKKKGLKIGFVTQVKSLQRTFKEVLAANGWQKNIVMTPNEVVKNYCDTGIKFDVLLVDESHRLWRYRKIGRAAGSYKNACASLYGETDPSRIEKLCREKTALDWIFDCSKTRILVYDALQTVRESDITKEQYNAVISSRKKDTILSKELTIQMRCMAGMDYLQFLNALFDNKASSHKKGEFGTYDFMSYDSPNELIADIVKKNKDYDLSRVVAGYGWQWQLNKYVACEEDYKKSVQSKSIENTRKNRVDFYLNHLQNEDGVIEFEGGCRYVRNLDDDWLIKGDPREIGCIHTCQGYDLNYVGVLFGPEIDYDSERGVFVDAAKLGDTNSVGKNLDTDVIRDYVINAYKVMMERGIKDCYVYAYNLGLREYLRKMIPSKEYTLPQLSEFSGAFAAESNAAKTYIENAKKK